MRAQNVNLPKITRDVALWVSDGFQIQNLSGPLAAFELAASVSSQNPYQAHVVSARGGRISSSCGLKIETSSLSGKPYDTFIVLGGAEPSEPTSMALAASQVEHGFRGARRIASVCTGAFLLAATGVLDGRRATTHWKHTASLQRMFPRVRVQGERIYTKDGHVWTSAGVAAGIDLALALIEEDLGTSIARGTAQSLVVHHRRPGSQYQYSRSLETELESDRIREVLAYVREHLTLELSVERLAEIAGLSPRQFGRIFRAETGETPAKAVERLRAEAARPRIELSTEPVERVARHVGFTDPERMRRAFIRLFGHPPQTLRRMAGL
jgi:transcriptional regulator GlxA family with amidase domain